MKHRSPLPGLIVLLIIIVLGSLFYRSLRGVKPLLKSDAALAEIFTADRQPVTQIQGEALTDIVATFRSTKVRPVSRILQSNAPYRIHFLDAKGNAVCAFRFGDGMLEQDGYILSVLEGPMPYEVLSPYLTH